MGALPPVDAGRWTPDGWRVHAVDGDRPADSATAASARPVLPGPRSATDWPLVGRAAERSAARQALTPGGGAVLVGDPGVGKTRLAREVAADAAATGWSVEWATATEAASAIAFGAVAPLVVAATDGRPTTTLEVLTRTGAAVAERARGGARLLLVLDDVHLVDGATAALVHQLVARRVVAVLLTLRRGAVVPDPVRALWKDDAVARVDVEPLTAPQVAEVLSTALAGIVDGPTRQLLWETTGGNAFALRELVRSGLETGRLTAADGVWHWSGDVVVGDAMAELVLARLGGLSERERELLELIALGQPLGYGNVLRAGYEPALRSLERHGLLATVTSGRRRYLRLAHPLYGESLRAMLPAAEGRAARLALAAALERTAMRRRDDALRVAVWRTDAGEPPAVPVLLAGARRAGELADHRLMERLAGTALTAGGGFDAALLLAQALAAQGRWAAAERICATPPLSTPETVEQADRAALLHAEVLFVGLHRPAEARALLAAAGADPPGSQRAALRAHLAFAASDLPGVVAEVDAALAAPAATELGRARTLLFGVAALALMGRAEAALERAELARPLLAGPLSAGLPLAAPPSARSPLTGPPLAAPPSAEALAAEQPGRAPAVPLPVHQAQWVCAYTLALTAAGRFAAAVDTAAGFADRIGMAGDEGAAALAALALGHARLEAGTAGAAVDAFREAAALLSRADRLGLTPWCLAGLARAAALAGDHARAAEALAGLVAAEAVASPVWGPIAGRARCWVLVAHGELTAARAAACRAARDAVRLGQLAVAVEAWHDLARFGDPVRAAADLSRPGLGPLAASFGAHAHALAAADADALADLSGRFAASGALLFGAEAAAAAACAAAAAGRPALALSARRDAERFAAGCGTVRTPLLARLARSREAARLTAREEEVAGLAGRGLASALIAERLGLSVRTVEGHLQRAYDKLGLRSRAELAAVFGGPPAAPVPARSAI